MTSLSHQIQPNLKFNLSLNSPVKQTNKFPLLFKPVTLPLNAAPGRQQLWPCCFWNLFPIPSPSSCQIFFVEDSPAQKPSVIPCSLRIITPLTPRFSPAWSPLPFPAVSCHRPSHRIRAGDIITGFRPQNAQSRTWHVGSVQSTPVPRAGRGCEEAGG